MNYEFNNKSFNNQHEFVEYLIKKRDVCSNALAVSRYQYENHGKKWSDIERKLLKHEVKSSDLIKLCILFGRSPNSLFATILALYKIDFYNIESFFSKNKTEHQKYKVEEEKDKGNDINIEMLIAMKIYILFRKINGNPYQDKVIKTIKEAIVSDDFQSFGNERKAFYLCSLCEIFRRLEMNKELINSRSALKKFSGTNLFNLYMNIIEEENKQSFNLNNLFDSTFRVNDRYLPFRFDPDKISEKYEVIENTIYGYDRVHSVYIEVSGTNNIPYILFNLDLEMFINQSLFLLDKTLPQIIESHFPRSTSENILRFIRATK